MTTRNEARTAIYEAFDTAWGVTTVFTFDNEDFNPPTDAAWARLVVRHNGAFQETLGRPGDRKFARTGTAIVQIFVLKDTGMSLVDDLLTKAAEAFEGLTLAGTTVRFQDVIAREVGPEGKWHMSIVDASFEYDETR